MTNNTINQEELNALIERVEYAIDNDLSISTEDLKLLLSAILTLSTLQQKIEDKDVTLHKLRKLLGIVKQSERANKRKGANGNKSNKNCSKNKPKRKPHVPTTIHEMSGCSKGQTCPECNIGKLYKHTPGSLLRITGHMPYSAEKHVTEKLRCNSCQHIYTAPLPEDVIADGSPDQQYGYSARTLMVINKFFTGTPYNHQSNLSDIFGLFISASTIFDQVENVANDVIPVYYELVKTAADSPSFMVDDTSNRILEQKPEERLNRNGKGTRLRTGVYTSGLMALFEDREIVLFETSLGHAGEHLDFILSKRSSDLPKPLVMHDALSSNNTTVLNVETTNCNAHSRRQFYDLESSRPTEVTWLLNKYAVIWDNERKVKNNNLDFTKRLEYHKNNSLPIMEEIKTWALEQKKLNSVEENSSYGKALNYFLKRYDNLIKFCTIPGALIDNNRMEESLKIVIRGRKNSHFYKTVNGAGVANVLISIVATAYRAEVNIFEYLLALQKNKGKVKKSPNLWLPWNYLDQIQKNNTPKKEYDAEVT